MLVPLELDAVVVTAQPAMRGPGGEALRAFAHTYLTELARQPRRAMSAAGKAHGISRATAHRWAHTCRELGYLRTGEQSGSWVDAEGENLPVPVKLRVNRRADGRHVVTGLLIGGDDSLHVVTSETLRQIRLAEILGDLNRDYEPSGPVTA